MPHLERVIAVSLLLVTSAIAADLSSSKQLIRSFDFKKYLLGLEPYRDCPESVKEICAGRTDTDYCPQGLDLSVSYADLTEDGVEEAIVQGRSCNTGTAGPDIHSVYASKGEGGVKELKVPDAENRAHGVLFGNRNYELTVSHGQLVAAFTDTSGRKKPLVIRYKWVKNQFQVISVAASPTFKTSYDCAKASDEHERAICHVQSLADLDIKLAAVYKKALEKLPPERKKSLVQQQREWIRKRNASCTLYKWWVECLEKEYNARLSSLESW